MIQYKILIKIDLFNIKKENKLNNKFICYYYYQKTLTKQEFIFVQS